MLLNSNTLQDLLNIAWRCLEGAASRLKEQDSVSCRTWYSSPLMELPANCRLQMSALQSECKRVGQTAVAAQHDDVVAHVAHGVHQGGLIMLTRFKVHNHITTHKQNCSPTGNSSQSIITCFQVAAATTCAPGTADDCPRETCANCTACSFTATRYSDSTCPAEHVTHVNINMVCNKAQRGNCPRQLAVSGTLSPLQLTQTALTVVSMPTAPLPWLLEPHQPLVSVTDTDSTRALSGASGQHQVLAVSSRTAPLKRDV